MDTAQNEAMKRIRLVSKWLAMACVGMMGAALAIIGTYWITVEPEALSIQWLGGVAPVYVLTPLLRAVCLGLTLVAALPVLLALKHLRRLFLLYAGGTMFSELNVKALRGLGWSLILFALIQVFFEPVMGLVLSMSNPPGERVLNVGIGAGMLIAAFIGSVLLVIARVMNEARKIDEEQQLTV